MTMHGRERVGADAAVLLGDVRGVEVARRTSASCASCGKRGLLVDLGRVRRDLVLGDRADRLADGLVVLGEPEQVEVRVRGAHLPDITRG